MLHARPDYNRIQDPANLIPEDEPVFLVRAQDVCSVATMDRWIEFARISGASQDIIDLASDQMERMKDWQLNHKVKVPDL